MARRSSRNLPAPDSAAAPGGGCLARVRSALRAAAPATGKIGRFVLQDPPRVRDLSVTSLARACGVSQSAVSRFCTALGYSGFKTFQLDLAAALARAAPGPLDDFVRGESPAATVARVFAGNRQTLVETEQILDRAALAGVTRCLERADRICVLGLGASGLIARYAVQRFLSLGLNAAAAADPYDQLFATAATGRGDVVLGISHSGETAGVVEAVRVAARRGARTVAVTNYPNSALAAACEFRLITAFRENRLSAAFSSSHVAQMSVIDSLYFLVAGHRLNSAGRLAQAVERRAENLLRRGGGRT